MTKHEFDQYVFTHGPDILRFCKMTTASDIEGEELYQDTMLTLLEQLNKLDSDKNIKSYALSVAVFLRGSAFDVDFGGNSGESGIEEGNRRTGAKPGK